MGFGSHYVSSLGWCFSTDDYNEWINKHYHNSDDDDDDDEKNFLHGFTYLFVMNAKNIESLEIIYVHSIDHIDFWLHVIIVKRTLKRLVLEK